MTELFADRTKFRKLDKNLDTTNNFTNLLKERYKTEAKLTTMYTIPYDPLDQHVHTAFLNS